MICEGYRPCLVGENLDKRAVFHRWADVAQIVSPSMMIGGHGGGVVKDAVAIVEMDDGTVREVVVENICFLDSDRLFNEMYPEGGKNDDPVRA